ncbi:MAG: glycosyltransferase family 4 protein [Flavisolibacter sp.]
MRIGIEAQRIFRPKKHGMDVVAIELVKSLQEIDHRNEYIVFSRNGVKDDTIRASSNFQIAQFPALTYADWEQVKLPLAARKKKLDLLHCTANTAPLFSGIPLVLTLHDIIYLENIDFKGTSYQNLGNLYRRWLVPRIVKKARMVLTVSSFERDNILEKLQLPEEKVQVLYNGVSSRFNHLYDPQEVEAFRRRYGLPGQYIMFLGNTAPKKNTPNVIRAFAAYCQSHPDPLKLVLLDYKKELVEKLLEELKQPALMDHFVFPGYVPHQEIPLMYNAATLFLYPSLRESFGLPLLEAMACGVPVITSNTSSMPEIAGDAALLVDPFDVKELTGALQRLAGNEELQQQLREKGLERARQFTWKASAEKLLSIYESLR